ncbi:MAG: hypothetical protein AB1644_00380 [Candidatus Zixiibacteriota bacterium]
MLRPENTTSTAVGAGNLISEPGQLTRTWSGIALFNLSLLTMLVQSVVVATAIKGLLIPYLLILMQAAKGFILSVIERPRVQVVAPFVCFVAGFTVYVGISQLLNLAYAPRLDNLVLVSLENANVTLLRSSLFTQGLYLTTCVLFFLYTLGYLKTVETTQPVMKLVRAGLVFFVAFGFYEFIGYLLTGGNVDFISNRITGDERTYSTFQTFDLAGLTIPRMKSLAGEASMFAFSVVPFVALFYFLRDRFWIVLLTAAVLSTSTTAYIGLFCLALFESLLARRLGKLLLGAMGLMATLWLVFPNTVASLVDFAMEKFRLEHMSGIDRMSNFQHAWQFFANSDILHMMFGYGFGYIRSTDGFTTLLVNVGVVGLIAFLWFLVYPVVRLGAQTPYHRGLLAATAVSVVMIMISVPEFYYLHVWLLAALAWFEYHKLSTVSRANRPMPAMQTRIVQ